MSIFENAKPGDRFVARNGMLAFYGALHEGSTFPHTLTFDTDVPGMSTRVHTFRDNGRWDMDPECAHWLDIVARQVATSDLRNADMRGANMRGANMRHVDMHHADMRRADMRHVDMREADMREANMYGANMSGADMREADMCGAFMRGVKCGGVGVLAIIPGDRYTAYVCTDGVVRSGCREFTPAQWREHAKTYDPKWEKDKIARAKKLAKIGDLFLK